ncbi:MAG: hypothetical protein V4539_25420 [Bacteroidota bacterium]
MLNYYYVTAFGYANLIAMTIGLVRFKKILKPFRLFVIFLVAGAVNDALSTFTIIYWHTNAANGNIYILIEAIILLFIFYNWGSFGKRILYLLLSLFVLVWVAENLVFGSLLKINSFFRLFYSLAVVILSIDQINVTMMHERKNLFRNAKFIICFLFAFYYTFKAVYEVFYVVPMKMSDRFDQNLFLILVFVNLFTNLGYALATLWMPTKQKLTLPY